jgi:hypothetical protein
MTMEARSEESRVIYGRLRRINKTKLAATLCAWRSSPAAAPSLFQK